MSLRRLARSLACASLLGAFALAEPRPSAAAEDAPRAEALYQQGKAAFKKGDFAGARASFAESQRLDPAAGTLLYLAECEERLGLLASAWEHAEHAVGALAPHDERLAAAKQRVLDLEKRLPRLLLTLAPDAPPGARVRSDSVELGAASLGVPLPIDPGAHEIVVSAPGRADRRYAVALAEKETKTLVVTVGPALASAPAPVDSTSTRRTLAYVAGGAGAVGVIGAVVTGVVVKTSEGTAANHCPKNLCDPAGIDAVSRGKTMLAVNAVAWGVGVVGLGVGVYLSATSRSSAPAIPVTASISPTAAEFTFRRSF